MNRLTNKEYVIDIMLKTLQTRQSKTPSKILCQIHYGDNYLKMKLQPSLKNGIASFYQQRIRIPFANDVALVFKMLKNNKKQVFLGHYPLQLQKYLQQKQFMFGGKQKLEQTEAWVDFQCRIIDKANFDSDSEGIVDDDIQTIKKQVTNYSIKQKKFSKFNESKQLSHKPLSLYEGDKNFVVIKKPQQFNNLLTEQYDNQLATGMDIVTKKQTFAKRQSLLLNYQRDQDGCLRTKKIIQLQNQLLNLRKDASMNTFFILVLIGAFSFFLGFIIS